MFDDDKKEERRKTISLKEPNLWMKALSVAIIAIMTGLSGMNLSVSSSQESKIDSIGLVQQQMAELSIRIIEDTARTNSTITLIKYELDALRNLATEIDSDRVTKAEYLERNRFVNNAIMENNDEHNRFYNLIRYSNEIPQKEHRPSDNN